MCTLVHFLTRYMRPEQQPAAALADSSEFSSSSLHGQVLSPTTVGHSGATLSPMVGDIFNLGTWKVTLKIYNLLQPPSVFLILSMDCRAPPILSTLLTRTYLSVNGWGYKLSKRLRSALVQGVPHHTTLTPPNKGKLKARQNKRTKERKQRKI